MNPLRWIPTLYFFQGLPYALVVFVSVIFFKDFNLSNSSISYLTSILVLPWMIKPLFAPLLESGIDKKKMTIACQFIIGLLLACLAVSLAWFNITTLPFVLLFSVALFSALQDITTDGLYMATLSNHQQQSYVGLRTTFYQAARFVGEGVIVMLAGILLYHHSITTTWQILFLAAALICLLIASYHLWQLPATSHNTINQKSGNPLSHFMTIAIAFTRMPRVGLTVLFALCYLLPEFSILKITPLILLDKNGFHLSTEMVGIIYGTLGIGAMLFGAVIGGLVVARYSLHRCLPLITFITAISNIALWLLLLFHHQLFEIALVVALTQCCLGISSSAYMSYLLLAVNKQQYAMTFYAMMTALMAGSMIFAGLLLGLLLSMTSFSAIVLCLCIAGVFLTMATLFLPKIDSTS